MANVRTGPYSEVTYDSTGEQPSINCDPMIAPFQTAVACTLGTTGTYKVQYSFSPMTVADADAIWFDSVGIPAGTTANAVTTFIGPVARVRANIAALDSTLVMQVSQGISTN